MQKKFIILSVVVLSFGLRGICGLNIYDDFNKKKYLYNDSIQDSIDFYLNHEFENLERIEELQVIEKKFKLNLNSLAGCIYAYSSIPIDTSLRPMILERIYKINKLHFMRGNAITFGETRYGKIYFPDQFTSSNTSKVHKVEITFGRGCIMNQKFDELLMIINKHTESLIS